MHDLCGFLWIRASGVPYFKWFSAESFGDKWNNDDLFFCGFFSAISSSSEIFFGGDSLRYIEFSNYKIYSGKIKVNDIFVVITRKNCPEHIPQTLLDKMLQQYFDSNITRIEDFHQDRGDVENTFLRFLSELDSEGENSPSNLNFSTKYESIEESHPKLEPFTNISDLNSLQMQIAKLEKNLASVRVLGRTIGHTLNNLLSTIMGNVTLAKLDVPDKSEVFQSLEEAEDSCLRARDLSSQLLNISKTIKKTQETLKKPFRRNLSASNQIAPTTPEIKNMKEEPIRGSGTVLILDDNPHILETAQKMIRRLGYRVRTAQDMRTAFNLYKESMKKGKIFDAVILDLSEIGGLGEFGALIWRKIDPHITAIVSSGFSKDPIFQTYKSFGYRGVLKKPYNLEELGKTLYSVIGKPPKKAQDLPLHAY